MSGGDRARAARPSRAGALGLDAAVSVTVLARVWSAASGIATLGVVAASLPPVEQGFYYTFASLLAMQVFAELGVNFVVMQFASHEMARLRIVDGRVTGEREALARLSALFHFAWRWFGLLAAAFVVLLVPLGLRFLGQRGADAAFAWRAPWTLAVAATAGVLLVGPMLSLLEGCGEVASAARGRLVQAVVTSLVLWGALAGGLGLYAVPLSLGAGVVAVGTWLLRGPRPLLVSIAATRPEPAPMRMLRELLPMQWRISLSWLAGYFISQLFAPVLFARAGAVEAGRMGMSLGLAGGVSTVALVWVTTKSAVFGRLVAARRFDEMDAIFARALRQAAAVAALGAIVLPIAVYLAQRVRPEFAARLLPPGPMLALAAGSLANVVLTSQATYLRAFKREPFLPVSLTVGALTALSTVTMAGRYGAAGVAAGYCVVNWFVGVGLGTLVYRRIRRDYRAGLRA